MIQYSHYAWFTYRLALGGAHGVTLTTAEIRYHRGNQPMTVPRDTDLASLRVAIVAAVTQEATARRVPYPGTAAVLGGAELHTRSETDTPMPSPADRRNGLAPRLRSGWPHRQLP
jgi:hypothetical protein